MAQTHTIHLAHPIRRLRVVDAPSEAVAVGQPSEACDPEKQASDAAKSQRRQLAQLCETLNDITGKLSDFYQETITRSRGDIARLAVEIARKILKWKTDQGDYDIQTIVEETLKRTPTRQNIVIRLNPEDLPLCQKLQQESPDTPFAALDFVGDWGIGRANCLIETPKGIVKSSVDECLERIGRALEKAQ